MSLSLLNLILGIIATVLLFAVGNIPGGFMGLSAIIGWAQVWSKEDE